MCESNNNNMILLPQGQPGPLILDDNFLRVASTGITEEEDSNGGAIAAGVIVPLLVITAAVVGVIIFIWYYR